MQRKSTLPQGADLTRIAMNASLIMICVRGARPLSSALQDRIMTILSMNLSRLSIFVLHARTLRQRARQLGRTSNMDRLSFTLIDMTNLRSILNGLPYRMYYKAVRLNKIFPARDATTRTASTAMNVAHRLPTNRATVNVATARRRATNQVSRLHGIAIRAVLADNGRRRKFSSIPRITSLRVQTILCKTRRNYSAANIMVMTSLHLNVYPRRLKQVILRRLRRLNNSRMQSQRLLYHLVNNMTVRSSLIANATLVRARHGVQKLLIRRGTSTGGLNRIPTRLFDASTIRRVISSLLVI